jgi:hypothetical protein
MVKLSRMRKRAYVGRGMGRGAALENSLVKWESFHMLRVRFAADVPTNLAVPWVVVEEDFDFTVDETVSIVFAIRYVLP